MKTGNPLLTVSLALIAGLAGGMISGRLLRPKVITAQEFRVVDGGGVRAELAKQGLFLYDKDGEVMALLGEEIDEATTGLYLRRKHDESATVMICDETRYVRAELSVFPDGDPGLALFSEDGTECTEFGSMGLTIGIGGDYPRASLLAAPGSRPNLIFYDAQGEMRTVLGGVDVITDEESKKLRPSFFTNPDPEPSLMFLDAKGEMRTLLGGPSAEMGPSLMLFDGEGEMSAVLGRAFDATEPSLVFYSAEGEIRAALAGAGLAIADGGNTPVASLSVTPDGEPSVKLFDKEGTVIWQAPPGP